MKKKTINIIIFILTLFIVGYGKVNAESYPVDANDVPEDTYIIGTHAFTTNRSYLSTTDIMWASRSIENGTRDDMVIYYKDYNGDWKNGVTGNNITTPSIFEIEEVDKETATVMNINNIKVNGSFIPRVNEGYFQITHQDNMSTQIEFNAYNIADGTYDFDMSCFRLGIDTDEYVPFDGIGLVDSTKTITNGKFIVDMDLDNTARKTNYSCNLSLGENETFYYFDIVDEMPEINVRDVIASYYDEEGLGNFITNYKDGTYYINPINDETFPRYIDINLNFKNVTTGAHDIDISIYKNGELYEVEDLPTNLEVRNYENSYFSNLGLDFGNNISSGEYEIRIVLDNDILEIVNIIINDPTNVTFNNLTIDGKYYDEILATSNKKKTYSATFFTENIPDGKYNVERFETYLTKPLLRDFDDILDNRNLDFDSDRRIEVKNNRFTFNFVVPQNLEAGNYLSVISLSTLDGSLISNAVDFNYDVWGTKENAIGFFPQDDINEYGSGVYLAGRDSRGDGVINLFVTSEEEVDGFDIYSAPENVSENYILANSITTGIAVYNGIFTASTFTTLPLGTPKYYKVKPYILDGETKIYKSESDPIYILNGFKKPQIFFDNSYEGRLRYDDVGNATLVLFLERNKYDYADGIEIESALMNDQGNFQLLEDIEFDTEITDAHEYISKEINVSAGENRVYKARTYVLSNDGNSTTKIYSEYSTIENFDNSNS